MKYHGDTGNMIDSTTTMIAALDVLMERSEYTDFSHGEWKDAITEEIDRLGAMNREHDKYELSHNAQQIAARASRVRAATILRRLRHVFEE